MLSVAVSSPHDQGSSAHGPVQGLVRHGDLSRQGAGRRGQQRHPQPEEAALPLPDLRGHVHRDDRDAVRSAVQGGMADDGGADPARPRLPAAGHRLLFLLGPPESAPARQRQPHVAGADASDGAGSDRTMCGRSTRRCAIPSHPGPVSGRSPRHRDADVGAIMAASSPSPPAPRHHRRGGWREHPSVWWYPGR